MGLTTDTNGFHETAVAGTTPLRIWHCTHPRTASNVIVLAKQFRCHPQLAPKEYTFMTAFIYGPERLDDTDFAKPPPHAEKATFQNAFNELQNFLASIEQEGKHIFIKEHISFMLDPRVLATKFPPSEGRPLKPCPNVVDRTTISGVQGDDVTNANRTNPSVLPDSFFRTLSPIIQIRHPAISVPSFYRAIISVSPERDVYSQKFFSGANFAWPRITFDWFCEHVYPQRKETLRGHSSWPLVVDGDDLLNENERVITAICSLANLDTKGILKEWNPINEDIQQKQPDEVRRFLSTLQASNGIIKSGLKGEDIVVEEEAEKWVKEFGPEIANRLKEVVEAMMDDYMYLAQFRI
ncbi:MAG: hypothetical protein Q9226_000225 [Calogaya cf. arnoldii]